jgi:hypothetical protein
MPVQGTSLTPPVAPRAVGRRLSSSRRIAISIVWRRSCSAITRGTSSKRIRLPETERPQRFQSSRVSASRASTFRARAERNRSSASSRVPSLSRRTGGSARSGSACPFPFRSPVIHTPKRSRSASARCAMSSAKLLPVLSEGRRSCSRLRPHPALVNNGAVVSSVNKWASSSRRFIGTPPVSCTAPLPFLFTQKTAGSSSRLTLPDAGESLCQWEHNRDKVIA